MSAGDGPVLADVAQGTQHHQSEAPNGDGDHGSPELKRKAPSRSPERNEEDAKRTKVEDRRPSHGSSNTDTHKEGIPIRRESTTHRDSSTAEHAPRRRSIVYDDLDHAKERRPSGGGVRDRVTQEDRKRGQRLFGGILSALSQKPAGTTQQKRRQDVERRQNERVRGQRVEDDKRHADRLAKTTTSRKIEQVKFDEQVMHTRHTNIRARAKTLQTRAEPRIHYMPWELTRAQEDTIKDQIDSTEAQIRKELDDFQVEKARRLKELGVHYEPTTTENTVGPSAPKPSNPPPAKVAAVEEESRPATAHGHEKDHDEARDIMVETEEDTVIY